MSFYVPGAADVLSHDISSYPEGLVIPIDKPFRWTSADVIRKLKYAAIRHFGKKNLKVGHAGTLDPLATGVLLVCIGDACKRAQELQNHSKEYEATVRFGLTTPSYDLEKAPDRSFPYSHITREAVEAALQGFIGEQEQVAPLFSAKSVDGVRAYELARKLYKSGEKNLDSVAGILQRNRITITSLDLLSFLPPEGTDISKPSLRDPSHPLDGPLPLTMPRVAMGLDTSVPSRRDGASYRINLEDTSGLGLPEAKIRIACSKGTYIRAFARDLGEALGSGAHLSSLVRTRSGEFHLGAALSVEQALNLL